MQVSDIPLDISPPGHFPLIKTINLILTVTLTRILTLLTLTLLTPLLTQTLTEQRRGKVQGELSRGTVRFPHRASFSATVASFTVLGSIPFALSDISLVIRVLACRIPLSVVVVHRRYAVDQRNCSVPSTNQGRNIYVCCSQ